MSKQTDLYELFEHLGYSVINASQEDWETLFENLEKALKITKELKK